MDQDVVITRDGLLLAAVGVRSDTTTSGNPWHDPRTGKFANAPPGVKLLRGLKTLTETSGQTKGFIEKRRKLTNPDAMAVAPDGDNVRVLFFRGGRLVDDFKVAKDVSQVGKGTNGKGGVSTPSPEADVGKRLDDIESMVKDLHDNAFTEYPGFKKTVLPDDRRLNERMTRRRHAKREGASKQPARSVTKPHQHHMVAVKEEDEPLKRTNREWVDEMNTVPEVSRSSRIRDWAKWRGMTPQEYEEEIAKQARELLRPDRTRVSVRVPRSVLTKFVEDGRLKSQYETGKSKGYLDPEYRMRAESSFFGRDPELKRLMDRARILSRQRPSVFGADNEGYELRKKMDARISELLADESFIKSSPIYGYVGSIDEEIGAGDKGISGDEVYDRTIAQYGDVRIVLKNSVRERTTVTGSDSLDATRGTTPQLAPVSIDSPTHHMFQLWHAPEVSPEEYDPRKHGSDPLERMETVPIDQFDYVEAQIHDGVTLDDVERIVFQKNPNAALRKQLVDRGIVVEVQSKSPSRVRQELDAANSTLQKHRRDRIDLEAGDYTVVPSKLGTTPRFELKRGGIYYRNTPEEVRQFLDEQIAKDIERRDKWQNEVDGLDVYEPKVFTPPASIGVPEQPGSAFRTAMPKLPTVEQLRKELDGPYGGHFRQIALPETFSGWKLHVYAEDVDGAIDVYVRVRQFIRDRGLGAKIAQRTFYDYTAGDHKQRGKAVTIYLPRRDTAKSDTDAIIEAVRDLPGRDIQGDRMLAPNVGMRYEFGNIDLGEDVDPEQYRWNYTAAGTDAGPLPPGFKEQERARPTTTTLKKGAAVLVNGRPGTVTGFSRDRSQVYVRFGRGAGKFALEDIDTEVPGEKPQEMPEVIRALPIPEAHKEFVREDEAREWTDEFLRGPGIPVAEQARARLERRWRYRHDLNQFPERTLDEAMIDATWDEDGRVRTALTDLMVESRKGGLGPLRKGMVVRVFSIEGTITGFTRDKSHVYVRHGRSAGKYLLRDIEGNVDLTPFYHKLAVAIQEANTLDEGLHPVPYVRLRPQKAMGGSAGNAWYDGHIDLSSDWLRAFETWARKGHPDGKIPREAYMSLRTVLHEAGHVSLPKDIRQKRMYDSMAEHGGYKPHARFIEEGFVETMARIRTKQLLRGIAVSRFGDTDAPGFPFENDDELTSGYGSYHVEVAWLNGAFVQPLEDALKWRYNIDRYEARKIILRRMQQIYQSGERDVDKFELMDATLKRYGVKDGLRLDSTPIGHRDLQPEAKNAAVGILRGSPEIQAWWQDKTMTRHEQWEAIRRGLAERDVPGPQGDIVDPRTKAFDTIDRWVDGLVEDPAEAAGSKEALHALYEKHVTPELERLQATLGRPDAVITPMLSEDNIDSLTTADMDLELLRELQMPAFAPAFDVRLGTDDMAPSFTVFVNNDGSYSVDDVLPVGDTDFFRSEEQQNDYFATVGQLRGAQTEGEMTLHRAMSPAEYQAWESGEEIPTGKFFTVHRSTQYGVDVAGEFPDLFTVQVNAADVVETDPGTFQTIRPTRLVNGVVTSEPPPEAPGPQADVVEPLTDGPASAHLDSTYDEWGDSLTEDEVQALYVWRLSYGMYRINDQLRNGEPGGEVEVPGVTPEEAGFHRFRRSWASATRDVTDVIESMDSAIAKAPEIGIASKMDVYRGITDVTEFLGDDPWAKIGNTVTDRGFVATSTEESTAFDYATSDNTAAILEIELPAGTKGAWLRSVTERRGLLEWDRQTAEANFEFVLPRGSTFYVDDVTESNDLEAGIVTVKMRYVPHGTDLTPKQEELLRDKWDDPPEPRGIHAGRGGAGGFTSDDGETTLTDLGREGEALFTQLTGGELLHPPGKGEQSPLDVKFDGLGFEVKTVNANATSFKATLKKHEMSAKEEFARQLNLDPALAIVVIDRDAGVAKVYYRRGLKGGRLSRNTGWTFMADVPLS